MHVLITGGAGFIGSHLADWLLGGGHVVDVIDDLSTGSADNVAHLDGHRNFSCTVGSIFDEALLAAHVARATRWCTWPPRSGSG